MATRTATPRSMGSIGMTAETGTVMEYRGKRRVLIADGDGRVRRALAALLQADGSLELVGTVATAAAARSALAWSRPNVVVLDPHLPDLSDGLALVRQLSASGTARVVVMSATGALRAQALRHGADAFLEKDGDPTRLLQLLRDMDADV
jgi:DNA-binding NarL/FixJ family response regulator